MSRRMSTNVSRSKFCIAAVAGTMLAAGAAHASTAAYYDAQRSHGNIMHQWTFQGGDWDARLTDHVGDNDLVRLARGAGDIDNIQSTSSFAGGSGVRNEAVARQEGAGLHTSSMVDLPSTVTIEAVYSPDLHDLSANNWSNYIVAGRTAGDQRAFFLMQGNHGAGTNTIRSVAGNAFGNSADHFTYTPGDWYYSAVTCSTDGDNITVNAWMADLTSGDLTLTQVVNNANFDGTFGGDAYLGIGNFINEGLSIQEFFEGVIDSVAIYDGALTQSQLQANVSAIPEPASGLLILAGGAAMLLRRRQQQPA